MLLLKGGKSRVSPQKGVKESGQSLRQAMKPLTSLHKQAGIHH